MAPFGPQEIFTNHELTNDDKNKDVPGDGPAWDCASEKRIHHPRGGKVKNWLSFYINNFNKCIKDKNTLSTTKKKKGGGMTQF